MEDLYKKINCIVIYQHDIGKPKFKIPFKILLQNIKFFTDKSNKICGRYIYIKTAAYC